MQLARRGVELRLVLDGHAGKPAQVDAALLKAFARARCWLDEIASGQVRLLVAIARREGLPQRYVTRLIGLAFLAPGLVEAVAAERAPVDLNLQMLMDGAIQQFGRTVARVCGLPAGAGEIRTPETVSDSMAGIRPSWHISARKKLRAEETLSPEIRRSSFLLGPLRCRDALGAEGMIPGHPASPRPLDLLTRARIWSRTNSP
jgi:hypothetical protein